MVRLDELSDTDLEIILSIQNHDLTKYYIRKDLLRREIRIKISLPNMRKFLSLKFKIKKMEKRQRRIRRIVEKRTRHI